MTILRRFYGSIELKINNKMYHIFSKLLVPLCLIISILFLQSSCKKDKCTTPHIDSVTAFEGSKKVDQLVPYSYYTIHGVNLIETEKVILNKLEIIDIYLVRNTDTTVSFYMPNMSSNSTLSITYRDSLRLVKECGVELIPINILPPTPAITKISNEYAVPGDEILLRGVYFEALTKVLFPMDTTGVEGEILPGYSSDSCVVRVPEGAESGKIVLVSESGKGVSAYGIDYRPATGLIGNFDDVDTWDGWGGQVIDNASGIPPANGYYYAGEGADISAGPDSLPELILPISMFEMPVFSGHLTADYFGLEFEIYSKYPWQQGYYTIELGQKNGNDLIFAYTCDYKPWNDSIYNGNFTTTNWETHSISLSEFRLKKNSSIPIQSYSQIRYANYMIWQFKYPEVTGDIETIQYFQVALDNLRISQIKAE